MYKRLLSSFYKLSNLGQQDHFDEYEKTNNVLINQVQIFITFFIFVFVVKDSLGLNPDVIVTSIIFLVMISFFFLRKFMTYSSAVVFQLTFCVLAISFEFYIHNKQLRIEPLYITVLVLGILSLAKRSHKIIFALLIFFSYTGVDYAINIFGLHFQSEVAKEDNFSIFIAAVTLVGIITYRYNILIRKIMRNQNNLLLDLKSKNKELERFAYITSHDLKQPLRNIGSFAGLLRRFIGKPNREEKNIEYLNEIETSANRMNSLITEILSFSKINKTEITKEKVELDLVMEDFKRSHSEMLKERKAIINYKQLPTISGNKLYLSLLFQNLVENGIKYNTSENPEVNITSAIVGDHYEIKVVDNGIGISEEFRAAIFEPFKRLHSNKSYEGTGLGLSICMKIVETHNGKIWVENNSKESGTTFAINLPITAIAS